MNVLDMNRKVALSCTRRWSELDHTTKGSHCRQASNTVQTTPLLKIQMLCMEQNVGAIKTRRRTGVR